MIVGISWSKCIIWAYHCVLFRLYTFCIQKEKKRKTQVFLKNKGLPYEQECSLSKDEAERNDAVAPCPRDWVCLLGVGCLSDLEDTGISLRTLLLRVGLSSSTTVCPAQPLLCCTMSPTRLALLSCHCLRY